MAFAYGFCGPGAALAPALASIASSASWAAAELVPPDQASMIATGYSTGPRVEGHCLGPACPGARNPGLAVPLPPQGPALSMPSYAAPLLRLPPGLGLAPPAGPAFSPGAPVRGPFSPGSGYLRAAWLIPVPAARRRPYSRGSGPRPWPPAPLLRRRWDRNPARLPERSASLTPGRTFLVRRTPYRSPALGRWPDSTGLPLARPRRNPFPAPLPSRLAPPGTGRRSRPRWARWARWALPSPAPPGFPLA